VEGCPDGSNGTGFWKRLADSYKKHLFPEVQTAFPAVDANAPFDEQAAGYRKNLSPPPVSNPPWPYSVWNEGGTELIGYENMYSNALMDAIYYPRCVEPTGCSDTRRNVSGAGIQHRCPRGRAM
jgi:hypothetical protein